MTGPDALPARAPAWRDVLSCLVIWVGEPARRAFRSAARRVARLLAGPEPAAPRNLRPPPLPSPADAALDDPAPIDGHAVDLVRPYVLSGPWLREIDS